MDSSRRRVDWLKDAILPFLSPLLDRAYNCAGSTEYQPKVMKVSVEVKNQKGIHKTKKCIGDCIVGG